MALRWEEVNVTNPVFSDTVTARAKVPGGWLVRVQYRDGVGVTFYPDPDHGWDPDADV